MHKVPEVEINFLKRTLEHIHRVHWNMFTLITEYGDVFKLTPMERQFLMEGVVLHDSSKFSVRQYDAYIQVTKFYKDKKEGGAQTMDTELRKIADEAFEHHYMNENHHPEMLLSEKDKKGIWALPNILECACDLQAMADEFGEGHFEKYFLEVWLPKQKPRFTNWVFVEEVMTTALACFKHKKGVQNDLPKQLS